jgi:hypothetical protein
MPRSYAKWILGASLLAGGLTLACATERGLEPKPGQYRLYVGMDASIREKPQGYILTIDCATDSVADSLGYGFGSQVGWVVVSPDGRYLVVDPHGQPWVWDLRSRQVIATLPTRLLSALFVPDESVLLGVVWDSTLVFSVPSFELIEILPVQLVGAQLIPGTSRVIGAASETGMPNSLVVYDYRRRRIVDTLPEDSAEDAQGFSLGGFVLSPDGERLSGFRTDSGGCWLIGYDLRARRVLFRHPYNARGGCGFCRVTPDGREVWYTHGCNAFWIPWPESIHIVDAHTGVLLDTISISPDVLGREQPVAGMEIRFLPDGSKAYISGSCSALYEGHPLLVVDVRRREIIKMLFENDNRRPGYMDLAPVP